MDTSIELVDKQAPSGMSKAPDGGWGWVVVFGAAIAYFIADGWSYSFGIFFPVLIEHFREGKGKTAIIGALLYGIPMVISPFVCALTTVYGCRPVAMVGGLVTGVSFILSAFATSVDLLCLSTGILASFGLCMTYTPSIVAVTMYFEKKRGLATGLAVTGSGLGSFAFPPLLELLLAQYSWRGAILVLGAICFNIVAAGSLFLPLPGDGEEDQINHNVEEFPVSVTHVKRIPGNIFVPRMHKKTVLLRNRSQSLNFIHKKELTEPSTLSLDGITDGDIAVDIIPEKELLNKTQGYNLGTSSPDIELNWSHGNKMNNSRFMKIIIQSKSVLMEIMDRSLIKNWNYLLFCASNFILYMWIGIPYVYLVDKSELLGINNAAFLLSITGISRTIGQLVLGILGDWQRINTLGLFAATIILLGILTILVPVCTDYASLSIYAVLFGFSVSSTYALEMICIVKIVGFDKSTNAFGLLQLTKGISTLLGTPISGWLFDSTGHYNPSFYVAGALMTLSGMMLLPLPFTVQPLAAESIE